MANTSFFKNDGLTTALQTNLNDKADDAEKLAINPEDDQFTLSDGTTTGYSALHHKEKAIDAQQAAETAQTASETAQTASETAKTASEAAKVAAEGFRDTAETHKDAAASSATSASISASTATTKASEAATSASNSATSATNSETSKVASVAAQTASEAARDLAQGYRDTASTKATEASTSASSASTSASTATTKASEAATSATNSETSKVASVAAQTASEAARDLAEDYRDTAETHKNAAATSASSASTSAATATTQASNAASSASAASASQVAAAASAASAASAYDQFDDRYLGTKSSDPTTDNDGNTLVEGALYFSSTDNAMQVYDGSAWIAASSAGNVSITETHFTATAGQTTFNVSYTVDNLVVIMNGVVLQNGASKDYTATNGTSFTLASGASAGDELHVIVFKSFTTADMVSKTNGGAYSGSVDFTGGLEINGTAVTATAAELNTLDGITASTAELNLLDGVTATTAELNYVDGVTSNIQTQIDNISTDVVSDTTPQLGGNLDAQSNNITSVGNIVVGGTATGDGAADEITLSSSGNSGMTIDSGDTSYGSIYFKDSGSANAGYIQYKHGDDYMRFRTNGAERMRIASDGKVGIGTSTPLQTLDVSGVIRANCISTFDGTGSGAIGMEVFQPTAHKNAAITFHSAGDFAAYFGLDGSWNDLFWGGWSLGSSNKYRVWNGKNAPSAVLRTTVIENTTGASVGSSANGTLWTGTYNKMHDQNTSEVLVFLVAHGYGAHSGNCGVYFELNSSNRDYNNTSFQYDQYTSITNAIRGQYHFTNIAAGNHSFKLGWSTANGGSDKPFHYFNPAQGYGDARRRASTSSLIFMEIAK